MPVSTFCPDGKYHSMHQPRCSACVIEKLTADSEMHRKANESLSAALRNVRIQMSTVEEKEAASCPEDVGFDEYIRTLTASIADLRATEINTRYEVGVMSAITGRQDNETLTQAVTRVCHQLADTKQLLADKNTTANTFMEQIKRLQRIVEKHKDCPAEITRLKLEIEDACKHCCGYCKNHSVADAYREPSSGAWYHLSRESSTGRWYCAASPIRERRYQESNVVRVSMSMEEVHEATGFCKRPEDEL